MSAEVLERLDELVDLGEELGRGGYGVVRAGRLREDGRRVAIKLPHEALAREERERILREARLAEGLSHPRLTRLLGVCEGEAGRLALIYELVEGRSLERELGEPIRDLDRVAAWVSDAAEALDALHAHGLVHRDLKPDNLMVEPDGRLRLLDYGLLKATDAGTTLTVAGIVVGTPQYMAPEVLRGERAGPGADVYALGCLIHVLLTGGFPFDGEPGEIVRAHLRDAPPPVSRYRSELGSRVDHVVARALAKQPGDRFPSTGELARRLREAFGAVAPGSGKRVEETRALPAADSPKPAVITPRARPVTTGRWLRRTYGRAALGLVLVVVVGLAVARLRTPSDPPIELPPTSDPSAPVGPFGPDYPQKVRDELEEAQFKKVHRDGAIYNGTGGQVGRDWFEMLDRDPARWGLVKHHLVQRSRFLEWIAAGGDPLGLPASLRTDLKQVDAYYRGQELSPPYAHLLDLEPAGGPVSPRALLPETVPSRDDFPDQVGGWTGRAIRLLAESDRARKELNDYLVTLAPGQTPTGFRGVGWRFITVLDSAWTLTYRLGRQRSNRIALYPFLLEKILSLRRLLYATGRALREEPEARRTLAITIARQLLFYDFLLFAPAFAESPQVVFGGPMEAVEARLVVASLAVHGHRAREPLDCRPLPTVDEVNGIVARLEEELARTGANDLLSVLRLVQSFHWSRNASLQENRALLEKLRAEEESIAPIDLDRSVREIGNRVVKMGDERKLSPDELGWMAEVLERRAPGRTLRDQGLMEERALHLRKLAEN